MAGLGVVEPPPGQTGWLATPYGLAATLFGLFFFFFLGFFFLKKENVMGAFWE
jgi:hypothetical protein